MFLKLLKYKFNAQRNLYIILSAVALCMGAIGAMIIWLLLEHAADIETSILAGFAGFFGSALLMVIVYSLMAYTIAMTILLMFQFYKIHFSDEGYLTFTLPVTTHQHLLSSIVNILIWTVITMLVMFISILLIMSPVIISQGIDMTPAYFIANDPYLSTMIPFMIFTMIGSLVSGCVVPMVAISIGCIAVKKLKLLASFGIYYGINSTLSVITGISSFIALIGDLYIMDSLGQDTVHLILTALVPAVVYIGFSIGGYFLMHRLVDKKLNLP